MFSLRYRLKNVAKLLLANEGHIPARSYRAIRKVSITPAVHINFCNCHHQQEIKATDINGGFPSLKKSARNIETDVDRDSIIHPKKVRVRKRDITEMKIDLVNRSREVLERFGYPGSFIEECPDIIAIPPGAIENYILIMKESGFTSITPQLILTYTSISKKSINSLKHFGIIPEKENVLEKYFEILQLSREIETTIVDALQDAYHGMSLYDLRLLVLEHFLASRLKVSPEMVQKLMKNNPRTKHRSFDWITRSLKILHGDYEFPLSLISKNGYLLQGNPSNYIEILTKIDTIGGKSLRETVQRRPKILMTSTSAICQIQELFTKHGISDEAIAKYPEVFTLSPATIAERLAAIESDPQLAYFKSHPRVGRVLYYFTKVQQRLNYLEDLDIAAAISLHILSVDKDKFAKYVQKGELRNRGSDIVYFLASELNLSRKAVRLGISVHPHWLNSPTAFAKETLSYLRYSFSDEQIKRALPILLYSKEKVENALQEMGTTQEMSRLDPNYLHLVIYWIEKPFHFTGDGIWTSFHQSRSDFVDREEALPNGLH